MNEHFLMHKDNFIMCVEMSQMQLYVIIHQPYSYSQRYKLLEMSYGIIMKGNDFLFIWDENSFSIH